MKDTENKITKNGGFENGLLQLKVSDFLVVKNQLQELFPVRMTFWKKRFGTTPYTPSELIAIQAIFDPYNIDAFTGCYIDQ